MRWLRILQHSKRRLQFTQLAPFAGGHR
ncbi:hypothetical protein YPPY36_2644, partial [Yersinia pestis PY-36]